MISPEDFKNLADELGTSDNEAHLRTAISRYYYAAFHYVRNQMGQLFDNYLHNKYIKKIEHSPLQDVLGHTQDDNSQKLSATLESFHSARKTADYKLQESINPNQITLSILFYNQVVKYWNEIDKTVLKKDGGARIDFKSGRGPAPKTMVH